jgi:hypothetical protein
MRGTGSQQHYEFPHTDGGESHLSRLLPRLTHCYKRHHHHQLVRQDTPRACGLHQTDLRTQLCVKAQDSLMLLGCCVSRNKANRWIVYVSLVRTGTAAKHTWAEERVLEFLRELSFLDEPTEKMQVRLIRLPSLGTSTHSCVPPTSREPLSPPVQMGRQNA